jgi:hypothetical protein
VTVVINGAVPGLSMISNTRSAVPANLAVEVPAVIKLHWFWWRVREPAVVGRSVSGGCSTMPRPAATRP